jgi:hypothetical protein
MKSQNFKLTDISLQESQIQLVDTGKSSADPLDVNAEYEELFAHQINKKPQHHRSIIFQNETPYIRNDPSVTPFAIPDKNHR